MYNERKPHLIDILFIAIVVLFFIFVVAGGGGDTTIHGNVSSQYNVGSVVNNGVVGQNNAQQIAPTPAPQFSTDSVGNRMCWNEPSRMYVYSPCPQVQP